MEKSKDKIFTAQDILWGICNWKLEELTELDKIKILNYLLGDGLDANEYPYGMDDLDSLILEIISEED